MLFAECVKVGLKASLEVHTHNDDFFELADFKQMNDMNSYRLSRAISEDSDDRAV